MIENLRTKLECESISKIDFVTNPFTIYSKSHVKSHSAFYLATCLLLRIVLVLCLIISLHLESDSNDILFWEYNPLISWAIISLQLFWIGSMWIVTYSLHTSILMHILLDCAIYKSQFLLSFVILFHSYRPVSLSLYLVLLLCLNTSLCISSNIRICL